MENKYNNASNYLYTFLKNNNNYISYCKYISFRQVKLQVPVRSLVLISTTYPTSKLCGPQHARRNITASVPLFLVCLFVLVLLPRTKPVSFVIIFIAFSSTSVANGLNKYCHYYGLVFYSTYLFSNFYHERALFVDFLNSQVQCETTGTPNKLFKG